MSKRTKQLVAKKEPLKDNGGQDVSQRVHGVVVQTTQDIQQYSAAYHSPLPPPKDLQAYEETLPGVTERLVVLLEQEQERRIRNDAVSSEEKREILRLSNRGQLFAFVIIILSITAAVVCALAGASVVGAALAGVSGTLGYLLFHDKAEKP